MLHFETQKKNANTLQRARAQYGPENHLREFGKAVFRMAFSSPEPRSFWPAAGIELSIPAAGQKDRGSGDENVRMVLFSRFKTWGK